MVEYSYAEAEALLVDNLAQAEAKMVRTLEKRTCICEWALILTTARLVSMMAP